MQRSFTFRGDRPAAEVWCRELAEEYAQRRAAHREAPFLTVADLLGRWIAAEHDWKPSTVSGYRSNIRGLGRDDVLNSHRVVSVTPSVVRQAMARWGAEGAGPSVVGGRFRTLRSAIGWAHEEGIIDRHPLASMRGPSRGEPRRHVATKTRRSNRLTLGATTAALWHSLAGTWRARVPEESPFGPWLFSRRADHAVRLTTGAVGHRFTRLRDAAGIETATLHRLRHSVATHLVSNGQILKAQARLGHREASTTLRNYAHAVPLDDADVAESIEAFLADDPVE